MSRANPVRITPRQSRELAEIAIECNNAQKKKCSIKPGIYYFILWEVVFVVQINDDFSWEIISDTATTTQMLRDEGYYLVGD
jgi:hypothetical protein